LFEFKFFFNICPPHIGHQFNFSIYWPTNKSNRILVWNVICRNLLLCFLFLCKCATIGYLSIVPA
jgi:hypothetical protein